MAADASTLVVHAVVTTDVHWQVTQIMHAKVKNGHCDITLACDAGLTAIAAVAA